MTPVESNRMPWRWAFALAMAALLLHTPALGRFPLLDDWWVVPRVVEHGAPEPWPKTGDGSAIALGARAVGEEVPPPYMSRPALWAVWRAIHASCGGIDTRALHAAAWLAHALSTFLLAHLLAGLVSRRAALLSVLLFATAAHGLQAVSWIAAGGDTLATTCILVACLAVRRLEGALGRTMVAEVVLVAAASAALLCKESAIALFPIVGLVAIDAGLGLRRMMLVAASLSVAVGIAAVVRMEDARVGGIAWPTWEAIVNTPWNVGQLLRQAAAPVLSDGSPMAVESWTVPFRRGVGVFLVALPILFGVVRGASRDRRRIAAGLVVAVVALLPTAWVVLVHTTEIRTNFFGRLTYAPWIGVLFAVAVGWSILEAHARRVAWCVAVALLAHAGWSMVDGMRHEAHVDRRVEARLSAVAAIEPQEATVIVVDPHAFDGGLPLLGFGIEDAFSGAFPQRRRDVVWIPDRESLARSSRLRSLRAPYAAVDFTASDVPVVSVVSESVPLPTLGAQPITDLSARDPAGRVAPGPVLGIRVRGRALGKAVVTTWFTDVGVFNVSVPTTPGHGEWFLDAPEDVTWTSASAIDQVRVEGLAPGAEWQWRVAPPRTEVRVVSTSTSERPVGLEAHVPSGTAKVVLRWRFLAIEGSKREWVGSWVEAPTRRVGVVDGMDVVDIAPAWTDRIGFAGAGEAMTWREAVGILRRSGESGATRLQFEVKVVPVVDGRFGEPSAWRLGYLRLPSP